MSNDCPNEKCCRESVDAKAFDLAAEVQAQAANELPAYDDNVSETFRRIVAATPDQSSRVEDLKVAFTALERLIKELSVAGRRQSIAITHLETAQMYAVKAVFDEDLGLE